MAADAREFSHAIDVMGDIASAGGGSASDIMNFNWRP